MANAWTKARDEANKAVGPSGSGEDGKRGKFTIGGIGEGSGAVHEKDVLGKGLDRANPWNTNEQSRMADEASSKADQHYVATQGINRGLDAADQRYSNEWGQSTERYQAGRDSKLRDMYRDIDQLRGQSESQGSDARKTYSNTIQPRLKGIMETAGNEAGDAMTLKQAGDPNNAIHTAVRDMYGQQAQGVQKQGMADFGVMSALGAQAAAGQFGAPMTQGQQANIYSANQSQAGEAYAQAQRRMNDLKQQGIDRGFDESNRQYERGQGAKDRYRQSIGDVAGAERDFHQGQRGFRDEQYGYGADKFGLGMGRVSEDYGLDQQRSGIKHGQVYGKGERDLTAMGNRYGTGQQILGNRMAADAGARQGFGSFLGSMGGAAMGGWAGAAGSAAAGSQAGGSRQNNNAQAGNDTRNYSNYA